jgi:hypothetical protein
MGLSFTTAAGLRQRSSSIVACGFVAVGTCLFAEALLSNGCVYVFIKNFLPCSGVVSLFFRDRYLATSVARYLFV